MVFYSIIANEKELTMIYFDNAATMLLHPELKHKRIDELLSGFGNPSALHDAGLRTRRVIEDLRRKLAKEFKVQPEEIYFTSGATESNNILLQAMEGHAIITSMEHSSVRSVLEAKGLAITKLDSMDKSSIKSALKDNTTFIGAIHTNNEVGFRHQLDKDLKELTDAFLFQDCTQSFLKEKLDLSHLDAATMSSHKVGSLSGLGILYLSKRFPKERLVYGGSQEKGLRSGTENISSLVALSSILDDWILNRESYYSHVKSLHDTLVKELPKPWVAHTNFTKSPYILAMSHPSIPSEVAMTALNDKEIYVSNGSSCSAKNKVQNNTMLAITGDEALRKGTLRISFSPWNTLDEVQLFIKELEAITKLLEGLF